MCSTATIRGGHIFCTTSENAVFAFRDAVDKFGAPATILSDNGACFVGRNGRRKAPSGNGSPLHEAELLDRGMELINSRPYRP